MKTFNRIARQAGAVMPFLLLAYLMWEAFDHMTENSVRDVYGICVPQPTDSSKCA